MPRAKRPTCKLSIHRLYQIHKARCFYCGKRVHKGNQIHTAPHVNCPMCATRDHLTPLKWGGMVNNRKNVVLACYECNQAREQFQRAIGRLH